MREPVRIPERLARTSVAWEGERARPWLARLPALVVEVADMWDLDVGAPYEPGGNISWVAPAVRRSDGVDVVLKVQIPHPESAPEALGLRAWDGGGSVRLYDHDRERCALLLERCVPGTALSELGGTLDSVRVGAAIGGRLHAVEPPAGVPGLADVLDPWAEELEARLDAAPLDDPGVGRMVLDTMRSRPRACTDPVLLHGDLNPTNLLAASREPWLAIDPKPLVGDAAYDGPRLVLQPDPLVQPHPAQALLDRIEAVVETMGVDRDALLAWCLVNAVEMGAWASSRGDDQMADRCAAHVQVLRPHLP